MSYLFHLKLRENKSAQSFLTQAPRQWCHGVSHPPPQLDAGRGGNAGTPTGRETLLAHTKLSRCWKPLFYFSLALINTEYLSIPAAVAKVQKPVYILRAIFLTLFNKIRKQDFALK